MRNIPHVPPTMTLAELGAMLAEFGIALSVRAIGRRFEATVRNADGAATSTADTLPAAIRMAITDYAKDL